MLSYEEFLQQKNDLTNAFSNAIEQTLLNMGEDIKGIDWFSSRSKDYCKTHVASVVELEYTLDRESSA